MAISFRLLFYIPALLLGILEALEHADFLRSLWPKAYDVVNGHGMWVVVLSLALIGLYTEFKKTGDKSVRQIKLFIDEAEELEERIGYLGINYLADPEEDTGRRYIIPILNYIDTQEPDDEAQKPYHKWANDFYDYMLRLRDFFANSALIVEENEILQYLRLLDIYQGKRRSNEKQDQKELFEEFSEYALLESNFGRNLQKHISRMKVLHKTLSSFRE